RMISDGQHTSLIHWSPEGKSFIVTDSATFARKVLPMYFKHSAFQSFVRQLNMYGFHKVNRPPRGQRGSENQTFEFKHSQFQRDREDLLDTIKRK
ncbi:heat shock transcription factor, partial [Dichotomocladium elegans]